LAGLARVLLLRFGFDADLVSSPRGCWARVRVIGALLELVTGMMLDDSY
jgi:hypothetical protein